MNTPSVSSGRITNYSDRPTNKGVANSRQTDAGKEFRQILSDASQGPPVARHFRSVAAEGLEGGMELDASGGRFNIAMATSGRAVAFDARPVVGPTSVEVLQEHLGHLHQSKGQGNPLHRSPGHGQQIGGTYSVEFQPYLSFGGAPNRLEIPFAPPVRTRASAPILHATHTSEPALDNKAGAQGASESCDAAEKLSVQDGIESNNPRTEGRFRQSTAQQISRAQVLASMLEATDEYRIFVRGVTLDHREKYALQNAIKNMLGAYGLPDKPVAIVGQGREG
ncbi:hypothetical protein [Altererythrobacter sp. Z27]|uniref:hypothetical protein n=1 Tax=Altererythrobacter sp. Z27 TaxID=3461147 RepID=UPI0040439605